MKTVDSKRLIDAALSLRGKRVLVAGLGLFGGGAAAARYLVKEGAEVLVTDLKTEDQLADSIRSLQGCEVDFKLGEHDRRDFETADLVVANPAIPFRSETIQAAIRSSVPVTTEAGLFAARFKGKSIAVTGTSGKTTTTTLLAEMVSNAIPDTLVGGNMGVSLLDRLSSTSKQTTAVLELSSFQLRYLGMMGWRPDVAVVTNFTENHLDIHDGIEDYRFCKQQLIVHQAAGDVTVLNADDPDVRTWASVTDGEIRSFGLNRFGSNGVFVENEQIVSRQEGSERGICSVRDLRVPGEHNQANACAASCAAIAAGVGLDLIAEALASFGGVEHRLELCAVRNGVSFYNDSIATSPERTVVALNALDGPIILIAGGSEKGLNYARMGQLVSERVKMAVLMGETASKIEAEITGISVKGASNLEEAIQLATANAHEGDAVLFSPASASFDMFANFEERGRMFKTLVSRHT